MSWKNPGDKTISRILSEAKTVAVYGCSPKEDRTSYHITAFLIEQGYRVYPVHPIAETILGQQVYPDLASIPEHVDIVNVFRKAEFTPEVARQAVEIGAGTLWLQLGIINAESWKIATGAGLGCVMDRCIEVQYQRLVKQ
ncbi:CoA-binding protein [Mariprofundus sp. NF]|uniref:CoA-binding protein n=1 Tax=Mariprofundus sp. NF TaxID=2608716 RepID=UPI0015A3572D|nr:CoA-binding protein [Mariprofundus sp. NF]NWF38420.1 CoA-binding protein [Mariprofundus sp. NF]